MKHIWIVVFVMSAFACTQQNKKQSVRYMFWDRNLQPAFEMMKGQFEDKHPSIEVVLEIVPYSQYWQKLEAAAIGKGMPDVFHMNYPNTPRYYDSGLLYKWEGDYPPEIANVVTYYTQGMKDAYLKNGTYVVFPKGYDSQAFAVNTKIFEDAGVTPPTSGLSYKEVLALAEDLQPRLADSAYALAMEYYGQAGYMYFIYNMGGYLISSDGKTDGLDMPSTIAGIQEFKALFAKPYTPSYGAAQEMTASQRYANGQVAMVFMPSWEMQTLSSDMRSNTVILPLPMINGSNKTVVHAVGDAIYAQSQNLDAAKQWVAFMNSDTGLKIQAEKGIFFPVRDEDAQLYVRSFGIDMQPFYGQGIRGNTYPYPFTYEFGRFSKLEGDAISAAMEEGADIAAVLKNASADAKTFMK